MSVTGAVDQAELAAIRADFPVLERTVRGRPLVYLDSGATAQKPTCVLDAMRDFYVHHNAAVHRGAHALAEEATALFEQAREEIAVFLGARAEQVVITPGATAALNLVAYGIGNATAGRGGTRSRALALREGDEILLTQAEHHANLVPWQELAARTGAHLRWVEVGADGRLRTEQLGDLVGPRTRVVAFTHASNVTGAITDVPAFVAAARSVGAITVLDAAQSAPHLPLDLQALGVDFAAVAGHKMLGPTGIGLLYGRPEALEALPPVTTGGSMVATVTMTETTYMDPPLRFEAGTQPVAEAIGLAAAAGYLAELGMDRLAAHERELTRALVGGLADIPGVRLLGPVDMADRLAIASIDVEGVHAHDVGQVLDDAGVAVRVGHHCAQPLHRALGTTASTRASAGPYTTRADIEAFLEALAGVRTFFGVDR